MHCPLAGRCGGCPWLGRHPPVAARALKLDALRQALGHAVPATLADVGDAGTRDKLDLQWRAGTTGLFALGDSQTLVDITRCPLATSDIERLLTMWRADPPPLDRASVRLRAASNGALGLWLDVSHPALKSLLDERSWLMRWAARAVLELGPKAREVKIEDNRPTLHSAELRPWSSTWIDDGEVPLYTRIADFTQPSRAANRVLVATVMAHVRAAGASRVLELGAGAGNLTLPIAHGRTRPDASPSRSGSRHVRAVELDTSALSRNLGPTSTVEVLATSFARATEVATLVSGMDSIVADPPRSGLAPFADALGRLAPSLRPAAFVYVSCHLEALARDAATLARAGYQPTSADGVDQFPHTPHTEWVVTFVR